MKRKQAGHRLAIGLAAVLAIVAPQVVRSQVHTYITHMDQPWPVDPARPWGWAVKAYMNNPNQPLYNKAKAKLLAGEQVFSHTISSYDPERYCGEAPHFDFTWFEMQHSTMTFDDIRRMIAACPRVGAAPFVRMANISEGAIQIATDIGALGIVFATVEDATMAHTAAMYSRYPPYARRSTGAGQAASIWGPAVPQGSSYRNTIDDNFLIVVMIETPKGVENALDIAAVPGVDVVIMGNADVASFSGYGANSPEYQNLLTKVRNATYLAGKYWGNANAALATGNPLSADSRLHQNGRTNDAAPGAPVPAGGGRGGRGGRGGGRGAGSGSAPPVAPPARGGAPN